MQIGRVLGEVWARRSRFRFRLPRQARVGAVVLALVLAAAVMSARPAPADAASASCWKIACHGQSAYSTGCSRDGRAIAHGRVAGTSQNIYLYWSPTCETSWAVMPHWIASNNPGGFKIRNMWGWQYTGIRNVVGAWAATSMVYNPTWGCAQATYNGPPGGGGTACV